MKAIAHLLPLSENNAATASKNGMTAEQFAASMMLSDKGVRSNSDCIAVLKDRAAAIAALDRIALIDETESGSPYIPSDKIIAAILA